MSSATAVGGLPLAGGVASSGGAAAAIANDQPNDTPSIKPALLTPAMLTAHVLEEAAAASASAAHPIR